MTFEIYWPTNLDRWVNVLTLSLGALLSYLVHPTLWIVGPFGWVRRVLATAAQESGFNASAQGDTEINPGASVGVLQYNYAKEDWYPGNWRESPFLSGWATGRYWADASWEWKLALALPLAGASYFRWGWGHGTGNQPPALATAWDHFWDEQYHSAGGYWLSWLVTGLPTVLLWVWVVPAVLTMRALRRWRK